MKSVTFKAGGALTEGQTDVYIERQADKDVLSHVLMMDYLLVIEPRQQGKTSLINRLRRHPGVGDCMFVYVDVTSPNRSTESAWYETLCPRILKQLSVLIPDHQRPDIPHDSAGWRNFLQHIAVSASRSERRVVIELDEIGAITFPGNTEFFSVLRDIYNSRQAESEFGQLTFLLAGAFHPRNLIKDDKISPFNVAQRVRLLDFTREQVLELVRRGGWTSRQAESLSERIHYWTGGQPYLTQLLCTNLKQDATPSDVDAGIERVRREDENHLPPMLEKINGDVDLRKYLENIQTGKQIKFYPQENPRQSQLELIGVLKADNEGYCAIRNRIYEQVLREIAASPTVDLRPVTQTAVRQSDEISQSEGATGFSTAVDGQEDESPTETNSDDAPEPAPEIAVDTPAWPRKEPFRPDILIMKGGGVKGIAYVGALKALEDYDYRFRHFAGTSAGAISAALLAVGYTSEELGRVLAETDFRKFKDGWLPLSLLLLPFRKGLYRGDAFEEWLERKLRKKFPEYPDTIDIRFSHLATKYKGLRRLTVFASTKRKTSYPFDSNSTKHAEEAVSYACRCSMAIPYFFTPKKEGKSFVVDGGMQNNYPVRALLDLELGLKDSSDFIGLYLGSKGFERNSRWLLLDLFSIWGEAGDEATKEEFIDRTIVIDPRPVKTTDFSLSPADVEFLLAEGRASALHWLHYWTRGRRPSLEKVREAAAESARLRTVVIAERWRRFWPPFAAAAIALTFLLAWLSVAAHRFITAPRCLPNQSYNEALESHRIFRKNRSIEALNHAIDKYTEALNTDQCEVISIYHNLGEAFENRADVQNRPEDIDRAVLAYNEAITLLERGVKSDDLESPLATLLLDRGFALNKNGKTEEAKRDFRRVCDEGGTTDECLKASAALGETPPFKLSKITILLVAALVGTIVLLGMRLRRRRA